MTTLKPKLIKTENAEFVAGIWNGKNGCGYEPLDDAVLILPDKAAEKTTGGIIMTNTQQGNQSLASETGVVIAVGEGAFAWNQDRTRPWSGNRPKAGSRIVFERYAGRPVVGDDGEMYRLMTDSCIRGIRPA